jgi:hypothetical protein
MERHDNRCRRCWWWAPPAASAPASWRPAAPGFGHYQIRPEQTEQAVSAVLAAGYRHLDTARPTATRKPWRGASQQRAPRSS